MVLKKQHRRGAMAVLIAITLPVLLALAAFAIQFAYIDLGRVELRVATDAAAEAAARELSESGDVNAARAAGKAAALRNMVGGEPAVLEDSDIVFGAVSQSNGSEKFTFDETAPVPSGVRVNMQLQRNHLFRVLGRDTFSVSSSAMAGQIDRDVALVLDRSGSMVYVNDDGTSTGWVNGTPAPPNSRWAKVEMAAAAFLNTLQNDTPMAEKVSLITYSNNATLDDDLTFDYSTINSTIEYISDNYQDGATNIADGILKGQYSLLDPTFGRQWAAKTIVVMTDGIHNTGTITPVQAAQTAASYGITIHTITYGDGADQAAMQAVATAGGGKHWHAPNSGILKQVFNEIAANLPTMLME